MSLLLFVSVCLLDACFGLKMYRPPIRKFKTKLSGKEVPGIDYLSRGYNIMFGNPHTTGNVDEGISGVIFNFLNTSNGQTYLNYTVPNGVSVLEAPTCIETFTYNAITGSNSYSSSLTQDTSFDLKVFKAAFSASVDYQQVYKKTTTTKSVYTSSYTKCACYDASLNIPYDLPTFTSNFYETVYHMPNFYDEKNETNQQFFYDFFTNYFGTHYITRVTMGGIFGTLSSMNSFSYSTFSSSNLDISVSASYSTIGVSAAASSMTDTQKNESADFDSITTSKEIFNIGGNLPADNNPATWQKDLSINPLPIYYKFEVIPNLLTSQYFPKVPEINKKQSALQSALNVYCSLLSTNNSFGVIECSGYPPDPSIPGRSIIQGFYSSSNEGEPKNPYTNEYSCNDGYDAILYAQYWDTHAGQEYNSYYCKNSTMGKKDELNYFGGFYENCATEQDTNGKCNKGNYFTGSCSCPNGYSAIAVSDGFTSDYQSDCPWIDNGIAVSQVFLCYNKTVELSNTIMAGMYSTNTDHGACGNGWPNQYTLTESCHSGFTPYLAGQICCYDDKGNCGATRSTYMCLSNIYPV